jgi:hypothetical protein
VIESILCSIEVAAATVLIAAAHFETAGTGAHNGLRQGLVPGGSVVKPF